MNKIVELYTISTQTQAPTNWQTLLTQQLCAYLGRKCLKVRKSAPEISIGTCTVAHGQREFKPVIICPYRLLAQNQIFMDCIHLLSLHEPGNELHIIQEVPIPGGVVDYFLISTRQRKVRDFVGLELQTLDTTGTAWPERQRFLYEKGLITANSEMDAGKSFGMNWKMTAKTTLMQLHHETQTFEGLNKHLVLVVQDHFLDYMQRAFRFDHLRPALLGDPLHIHAYTLDQTANRDFRLALSARLGTDTEGVARCLGLQISPKVELEEITAFLENKIGDHTLLTLR